MQLFSDYGGGNKQAVQKSIQSKENEDLISDQISMVEYYVHLRNEWNQIRKRKIIRKSRKELACVRQMFCYQSHLGQSKAHLIGDIYVLDAITKGKIGKGNYFKFSFTEQLSTIKKFFQ